MSAMGSGATSHVCFAPVVSPPFDELLASDASDDAAGLHAGSATAAAAAAPVTSAPFKKFLRLISIQIPLPSGTLRGAPLPFCARGAGCATVRCAESRVREDARPHNAQMTLFANIRQVP